MRYQEVFARIRSLRDVEFGAGALPEEIAQAESHLGTRLPDSYRAFLREFGWVTIGPYEIYGVGADVPAHLDLVEMAKSDQQDWDIPIYLIPFYNDGASNIDCFDTRRFEGGECPIVTWYHELGAFQEPQDTHRDFLSWLEEILECALRWESEQECD